MTERKPPGVSFESWIDRQVREATERGEFDDLPGSGEPIPGAGQPYDEMWWVKGLMRREDISYLPPTLALRKEAEEVLAGVPALPSEARVRAVVGELNQKIEAANRSVLEGPPLNLMPADVEAQVERWRERRAG